MSLQFFCLKVAVVMLWFFASCLCDTTFIANKNELSQFNFLNNPKVDDEFFCDTFATHCTVGFDDVSNNNLFDWQTNLVGSLIIKGMLLSTSQSKDFVCDNSSILQQIRLNAIKAHVVGGGVVLYLLFTALSVIRRGVSKSCSAERRKSFVVTTVFVALLFDRSTALPRWCSPAFRNLVVGAAGCLCEVNGSSVCITNFSGAGLYYRNSNDVIFGPWSGACFANASGYFPFQQSPFVSVCPKVLGFCDSSSSTEVCCKDAGCLACSPYESGCMGLAPQIYSDSDWTTLKLFFNGAGCKSSFCNTLRTNRTCIQRTLPVICDGTGNVIELQLDLYNLSGSLVTYIAQLTALQKIILSNNQFNSTIPSELAQLSSLTYLDLSNNQFVGTVPTEFDQSNLQTVNLDSNMLNDVLPFFPKAKTCTFQTGPSKNDFCCAKGLNQPCCLGASCFCSVELQCPEFAPTPSRCAFDDLDGPDHALCMTSATLDDEELHRTVDGFDPSMVLVDNFTIAFWAKAREPLDFTEAPTTSGITSIPRGLLFLPLTTLRYDRGLGMHLGTDGFSLVWQGNSIVASIVAKRQSLVGWHHYSIVYNNGEPFVYVDGNSRDSSQSFKALDRAIRVSFALAFARTRYRYKYDSFVTGFEGWLSELRLTNRSMHGGEALQQMNNSAAWEFSYSMRGCSGENHTGSEIERFKLQQAWLVCRTPTTTTTTAMTTTTTFSSTTATKSTSTNQNTSATNTNNTVITNSTVATTTTAINNNSTIFTQPLSTNNDPPVWIFGAAGGGFVALLLIIGAIGLACWCNKRSSMALQQNNNNSTSMKPSANQYDDIPNGNVLAVSENRYNGASIVVSSQYGAAPPPNEYAKSTSSAYSQLPNASPNYAASVPDAMSTQQLYAALPNANVEELNEQFEQTT